MVDGDIEDMDIEAAVDGDIEAVVDGVEEAAADHKYKKLIQIAVQFIHDNIIII
jgi:hypothetical protein